LESCPRVPCAPDADQQRPSALGQAQLSGQVAQLPAQVAGQLATQVAGQVAQVTGHEAQVSWSTVLSIPRTVPRRSVPRSVVGKDSTAISSRCRFSLRMGLPRGWSGQGGTHARVEQSLRGSARRGPPPQYRTGIFNGASKHLWRDV